MAACYVIDDDPVILLIVNRMISKFQFFDAVKVFKNGKETLDRLVECADNSEDLPALMILDINMPVMDGWSLLDVLQEDEKLNAIPVVMLTSSIDHSDKVKAASYSQVIDFVSKPLKKEHLEEIKSKLTLDKST